MRELHIGSLKSPLNGNLRPLLDMLETVRWEIYSSPQEGEVA